MAYCLSPHLNSYSSILSEAPEKRIGKMPFYKVYNSDNIEDPVFKNSACVF